MPISFETLAMMELRRRPGEVLDDVARNGEAFVIERNGKQLACLVPISLFLPDIDTNRVAAEIDKVADADEHYRIRITDTHEIQLIFKELCVDSDIDVTVTLPNGYPNRSPIVSADPIDERCPHRWQDGSLCLYGAMGRWNPGKHDILHVLDLTRHWINHYLAWQRTGKWQADGG